METPSEETDTRTLVGDACLFTAAVFCPLVVVPPLAIILGPAAAWFLHDRRISWAAVIGEGVGIIISVVVVGGFLVLIPLISNAVGPIGGWEFTVPYAFLAIVSALFLALIVMLNIDGIRDLSPARRKHVRLDYARLIATLVIVIFVAIVSYVQMTDPETEIGGAGVFALAVAAVGAVTMLVMKSVYDYWGKRNAPAPS